MATDRYDVEYADGGKRTKLLNKDDADKLDASKGVKSVKKAAQNKGRKAAQNKGE